MMGVMGSAERLGVWFVLACLAGAVPAGAEDPLTFLTGETVTLDASGTEGHPTSFEWYVTPPGGTEPSQPTATGSQYALELTLPHLWQVHLVARYAHEAAAGGLYSSDAFMSINASSVVASLSVPQAPVELTQDAVLDGTASRVASGVTLDIAWTVDGPTPYTGCPTDQLTCTIPAGALDPGTYTATLTLTPSDGGDPDSDSGTFEVVDNTLAVDFTWTEDPRVFTKFTFNATLSPPSASATTAIWNFGDGSGDQEYSCVIADCLTGIPHSFPDSGIYPVSVTVTADDGRQASQSHQVTVGTVDPPPTAAFSVTPAPAGILEAVAFEFTGSCEGTCTWSWDFGDGTGSSDANPTHAYQRSGSFQAVLTVTNDSGQDTTDQVVQITDCWQPPAPALAGTRVPDSLCWGDRLVATAAAGEAFLWSTGATGPTADVSTGGDLWLSADQGSSCWGTVDFTVSATDCGDPSGDADLDGQTGATDLSALLAELTDGDGTDVTQAGGGDTAAPGGDVNLDGSLDPQDLTTALQTLFATP